jgi:hypothetical protein
MNADTARFAASEAPDTQDSRRAKVAPLLAAGMSVRATSAATGIPAGAVHRAKRQIEKMAAQQAEQRLLPFLSAAIELMVKQDINGVRQDVRRLTVSVRACCGGRNRAQAFGSRGPRGAVDRRQRLIRQHV